MIKKKEFLRGLRILDTNLTQLQATKDQGEQQLRELKNIDKSRMLKAISEIGRKNDEANKILLNVNKIDAKLDNAELVCTKIDGTKYDFNRFEFPLKFIEKNYNYEITLNEVKGNQDKLDQKTTKEELMKKEEKNNVLKSAVELFRAREDIIVFFKKKEFILLKVMYLKQKKR